MATKEIRGVQKIKVTIVGVFVLISTVFGVSSNK